MRGTKLEAWTLPPLWTAIDARNVSVPEGSRVPEKQNALFAATLEVLREIAADVRAGLLETVGIACEFSLSDGRASVILQLPPETDTEKIATAIAMENADAWRDDSGQVRLGINPWFSTKDVDQTVLCAIKVIHVMLGLHAVCEIKPPSVKQKILKSIADILQIQKEIKRY